MSTIKADNWQPSAGGTSVDIGGGLSKTWCHLNGTGTIAIQDSLPPIMVLVHVEQ